MESNEYNPDVLNCIANLSSDQVWTSPALANKVLDMLPQELFYDPTTTFLDPCCKTGVFLREIVKRLDIGLSEQIPDRSERIDHIMHKQVFGIATIELTSLISRRTLYCSKTANSPHSVSCFENEQGHIFYKAIEHTWNNKGKCKYCGASKDVYDRGSELEQYAYQFIHTDNPENLFPKNMKFDVIIGNPPYQLSDGGDSASDAAMPIYSKFIEQAIKLTPRYLSMIIPSKWMVGGRGLEKFRQTMMEDKHLMHIVDYEDASECFPSMHIDGGVCYFLWGQAHDDKVKYYYKPRGKDFVYKERYLKSPYSDIVIRDYRRQSIIEKCTNCKSFSHIVSSRKPFEIGTDLFNNSTNYSKYNLQNDKYEGSVKVYGVKGRKGGAKRVEGYVDKKAISKNREWIDKYKLLISKAFSSDAITPPQLIVADKNTICTETFLVIGPFDSKEEQQNCLEYTKTSFFKILLYFGRGTMQVSKDVFRFVPIQDFSHSWTDEMLYKKYGLDEKEIDFIESMIRPME